ncbi:hypothetical protein [Rhodococcoides yunnanense]|uniref:hypothetical protein n=1 Tax=Rhodococcoides yunnanense TaxID=278209 RepID=UPI0009338A85|nr:hypothetical protein [Rhodococcus yunnanensis]
MTDVGRRVVGGTFQVVGGLGVGVAAVWVLWQILPFATAVGVFCASLITTLLLAAALAYRFRVAGIAFGVSSTALNLILAAVLI